MQTGLRKLKWSFLRAAIPPMSSIQSFMEKRNQLHVCFYQEERGGLKWSPVHKVQERFPEIQSRAVQNAYRLHPLLF